MRLPPNIEEEVQKLANEYPYDIEYVRLIYMMGGYEHAKVLLDYKYQYKLSHSLIEQINQWIWDKKNKELFKELGSWSK